MAAPKGNQYAKGNPGPTRLRPVTQAIISKLHEIDKNTGKEYIYSLVDELFKQAITRKFKEKGKVVEIIGDLGAIEMIMNRSDGKPVQGMSLEGAGSGKVTIVFEPVEEKL